MLDSDQCETSFGRAKRRMKLPVVRQHEQRETDLVGYEPRAREPGPGKGMLALLDVLFACTPPVVKMDHILGSPAHVSDDETYSGEQLTLMPLHLGCYPSGLLP